MNDPDLLSQHCVEYPAGTPPMPGDEVQRLLRLVPGWKLEEGVLRRALRFPDFRSLIAFVNRLAFLAEEEQHHPDFLVYGYRRLRVEYATHSVGGLSLNDFIMAARTNQLLETEPVQEADR
jgi:4a-hydroxytetrahydrobiopterin dehydratase